MNNSKFKYTFIKISSNHEKIRDSIINCFTCSDIVIGQPVSLTGPPRDKTAGSIRLINTSPVKEIGQIDEITTEIKTESGSVYQIRKIEK